MSDPLRWKVTRESLAMPAARQIRVGSYVGAGGGADLRQVHSSGGGPCRHAGPKRLTIWRGAMRSGLLGTSASRLNKLKCGAGGLVLGLALTGLRRWQHCAAGGTVPP